MAVPPTRNAHAVERAGVPFAPACPSPPAARGSGAGATARSWRERPPVERRGRRGTAAEDPDRHCGGTAPWSRPCQARPPMTGAGGPVADDLWMSLSKFTGICRSRPDWGLRRFPRPRTIGLRARSHISLRQLLRALDVGVGCPDRLVSKTDGGNGNVPESPHAGEQCRSSTPPEPNLKRVCLNRVCLNQTRLNRTCLIRTLERASLESASLPCGDPLAEVPSESHPGGIREPSGREREGV